MKKALLLLAAIVVFALFVVSGCETDQAVTGIRIQNNAGSDITKVKILPAGATLEDFEAATPLNSSPISYGDYRDFETPAGVYDVQVLIENMVVIDVRASSDIGTFREEDNVSVVDGQVTTVAFELLD